MYTSNKKIRPKLFTITEYGCFSRAKNRNGNGKDTVDLPEKTFDALRDFVLGWRARLQEECTQDGSDFFSLSSRKGVGEVIVAQNYVGVISMKDGTTIEILPKISNSNDVTDQNARDILLKMLRTLKNFPFKSSYQSSLGTNKLPLFEIFIKMFVDETTQLTKQGLKSAYIPIETNENYFKGKLLIVPNMKANLCNRTRFFVRYDEFSMNRPENRLIKSTLCLLLKKTEDERNQQAIIKLLSVFEDIDLSDDYQIDLMKCHTDRMVSHYKTVLSWCQLFLFNKSFTPSPGSEIAIALLFSMEKLFESYMVAKIRHHLDPDTKITPQDTSHHLFDNPKEFQLKPDIVLTRTNPPDDSTDKDIVIVMDTKWKCLTEKKGVSQADMYQMYAYGKKYEAQKVVLIYPKNSNLPEKTYETTEGIKVEVKFIDLLHVDHGENSISQLIDSLYIAQHQ